MSEELRPSLSWKDKEIKALKAERDEAVALVTELTEDLAVRLTPLDEELFGRCLKFLNKTNCQENLGGSDEERK